MTGIVSVELVKALKALPANPRHRVRVAIAFRGMTQSKLAYSVGMNAASLSDALNGNRDLTEAQERDIAGLLEVPVAILFPKVAA